MTAIEREARVLAKLLKTARQQTDEASRRLSALKVARAEAESAVLLLRDATFEEQATARAASIVGFAHLAGYLEGARQKRAALESTIGRLSAEIEMAEASLEAAYAETRRFEHLSDRLRETIEARRRRKELAEVDAAALIRYARS